MRLHHIGFLSASLERATAHFVEAFGYRVESEEIEDVGQTATVRFLRQPGARHWLEIVSPLGSDSKLAGALARGVSLHHLCYEVEDAMSAIATVRERGCMPLGPPEPGAAFDGRPIVWVMDPLNGLTELVEAGPGRRSLAELDGGGPTDE